MLTMPVSPGRDHIGGPAEAEVTLLLYGDYECPYTRKAHRSVKDVQARMGERLRFVFRNFPLEDLHPHALRSAETAEAAAVLGAFWEMHDLLFENQKHLEDADLWAYASELDLDMARFDNDMENHVHAERVREDLLSGERSGVRGTPTFYINDVRHSGLYDATSLLEALDEAASMEQRDQ